MTPALHPKARRQLAAMTDSRGRREPLARTRREIAEAWAAECPVTWAGPEAVEVWAGLKVALAGLMGLTGLGCIVTLIGALGQ